MAGKGPPPKPSAIRQRRNKKPGATELPPTEKPKTSKTPKAKQAVKIPTIPNPDKRKWHPLTRSWWKHVWESPMAVQYMTTDVDGLGRLALLVDQFYLELDPKVMTEIRLQEARFGLSPSDRNRLQWAIPKHPEAPPKNQPQPSRVRKSAADPRGILGVVT